MTPGRVVVTAGPGFVGRALDIALQPLARLAAHCAPARPAQLRR